MRAFTFFSLVATLAMSAFSSALPRPASDNINDTPLRSAPEIISILAEQVQPHIDAIYAAVDAHNGTDAFYSEQISAISNHTRGATTELASLRGQATSIILSGADDAGPLDIVSKAIGLVSSVFNLRSKISALVKTLFPPESGSSKLLSRITGLDPSILSGIGTDITAFVNSVVSLGVFGLDPTTVNSNGLHGGLLSGGLLSGIA